MTKHLNYDEPVLRYHEIIAELVTELAPAGGTVADLGCGPGQTLGRIAELRPDLNLVGVDGDQVCLNLSAERAPSAELKLGDITSSDASVGPCDVVCSSHSLEHLPNPADALNQWTDMLTPNGRLVVAVPNSHQPIFLLLATLRSNRVNEGHFYAWDRATFTNFCRLAGFDIVQWCTDYVPFVPVRWRLRVPAIGFVERALVRLLPGFSNSHIVVLQPKPKAESLSPETSEIQSSEVAAV